jgi:hypothetical protein
MLNTEICPNAGKDQSPSLAVSHPERLGFRVTSRHA